MWIFVTPLIVLMQFGCSWPDDLLVCIGLAGASFAVWKSYCSAGKRWPNSWRMIRLMRALVLAYALFTGYCLLMHGLNLSAKWVQIIGYDPQKCRG